MYKITIISANAKSTTVIDTVLTRHQADTLAAHLAYPTQRPSFDAPTANEVVDPPAIATYLKQHLVEMLAAEA